MCAGGITYHALVEAIAQATERLSIPKDLCLDCIQPVPPFAVVASSCVDQHLGPIRHYPWGSCIINDVTHSNFALLGYGSTQHGKALPYGPLDVLAM